MRYDAWRLRAAQPVTVSGLVPGRACDRAERGRLDGMVKQKVDLLALRNDERAALLLVALRGDF